jgi:hypothetical protein
VVDPLSMVIPMPGLAIEDHTRRLSRESVQL